MVNNIKLLEKYKPRKLIMNNILPRISIFFLPNLSEIIPENILASKIPKAFSDKTEPIISKRTLKLSARIGIKGPTIDAPNPNIKNCVKKNGNTFLLII